MKKTAREELKNKKRIVIKIGSSSLTHPETGDVNLVKIERLIRVISDLRGMGKEVVLVSSGAIAAGRQALGCQKPQTVAEKQAYAAVGQARLMMVYQKNRSIPPHQEIRQPPCSGRHLFHGGGRRHLRPAGAERCR